MLRSIRLKNFRSLRDTGEVELRPIVLLVGANSSGKSSFLRFFPLLKQTVNANSHSPLLWYLDNADVDFGDFRNALLRGAIEPWIEISATENDLQPVAFTSRVAGGPDGRSYVQRFTVSCHGNTIELSAKADSSIETLRLNGQELAPVEERLAPRLAGPVIRLEGTSIRELGVKLLTQKVWECVHGRTGDDKLATIAESIEHGTSAHVLATMGEPHGGDRRWQEYVASLSEDSAYVQEIKERVFLRDVASYIRALEALLTHYAQGVRYLGPFRRPPQRFYRRTELATDEIDRDGSNLAMFLDSLSANDSEAFSSWLRLNFGFGVHTERHGAHASLMIDTGPDRGFNLMDMGFGMSQLLPVVAQCWLSSRQLRSSQVPLFWDRSRAALPGAPPTMIAVEQPELHLHPQHQAQLADMFRSTVNATRDIGQPVCLCIETHSEAMIYRFGELVESGELRREDISILFFEKHPDKDESSVRQIEFGADGVLQGWPIGFFRG